MAERVTLKDIAKEMHLSVTTISKAINDHPDIPEARKQEIKQMLRKRNYIPNNFAKSLRTNRSSLISVICEDNVNPYNARVISAMEHYLAKLGYQLLISNTSENVASEKSIINELLSINIAGVLICPADGNRESLEILNSFNIPYVLFNRYIEKDRDSYVVIDDYLSGKAGGEYLTTTYQRPVYFLCNELHIQSSKDRFAGLRDAAVSKGMKIGQENLITGIYRYEDGYECANTIKKIFLDQGAVSVLCSNDYIAMGLFRGLKENGLSCPEDVAVVGIDGLSMFSPFLTSVFTQKNKLGELAAKILVEKIRKQTTEEQRIVIEEDIHIINGMSA